MLILRSSSTFTVPKGVKKIDVFCVGGGGAGGYKSNYENGNNGSISSVGSICNAEGGQGKAGFFICYKVNNGGSGSGAPGGFAGGSGVYGGDGGTDGGNGGDTIFADSYRFGGVGQGTTTRYFGESTGTLYAGGGGGGGDMYHYPFSDSGIYTYLKGGAGGAGGGGNGGAWVFNFTDKKATAGGANTGGGGGGSDMARGGGGGYTKTVLGADVNPGDQISVVVGSGGEDSEASRNGTHLYANGGSGICIIRWDNQKS